MCISGRGRDDVAWWLDNIYGFPRDITLPTSQLTIFTDASLDGWRQRLALHYIQGADGFRTHKCART